jgi:hypothetical protein
MNYLQAINLSKNLQLQTIKLSGNQISHIENFPRSLKHLEIS